MKAVVAVDSFKGSLSSMDAGHAISAGIRKVYAQAEIAVCPIADGGEGTVDALVHGMNGTMQHVLACSPLGHPVECSYGILEQSGTAIIEIAAAAGLVLVPERERNPLYTTTYGVGEIIRDAIEKGCRRFIIGIGGSATNDGGVGMLQALGFGFLDDAGAQIPHGAAGFPQLKKITDHQVIPELKSCTFRIACDVTNPLCGAQGCSAVYGPQKGADDAMIAWMDHQLGNYAQLTKEKYPDANPNQEGAGAAGGLGFAFQTFLNAKLESGIQVVLEEIGLEKTICDADIVITGEGRLDEQTVMGKAPVGIARIARKHHKPVIAFCGCAAEHADICNQYGIDAFFPIMRRIATAAEAMEPENAKKNLTDTTEQTFRLIKTLSTIN